MDSEIRQQLEEIHALAKDNHRMLRAIRRAQWFNFFSSVVFWLAVLVIPLYLYQQYLAPTISKDLGSHWSFNDDHVELPRSTDFH